MITIFEAYIKLNIHWERLIIKSLTTRVLSHISNVFLDDVNIDQIDSEGYSPLMILAYHSNRTIVSEDDDIGFKLFKTLIDNGADWNIVSNEGDDFIDILEQEKLSEPLKNKIIKYYPEKYQDYLIKKETNKYNI